MFTNTKSTGAGGKRPRSARVLQILFRFAAGHREGWDRREQRGDTGLNTTPSHSPPDFLFFCLWSLLLIFFLIFVQLQYTIRSSKRRIVSLGIPQSSVLCSSTLQF